MSKPTAAEMAQQFLEQSGEFRLGELTTEQPHPKTRQLSHTARMSVTGALEMLFQVDDDVAAKYREWISTGEPERIRDAVLTSLRNGGRIFFTGCGATGRLSILLDAIWRDFWSNPKSDARDPQFADRTRSVMAGGDYALIKSVEGFEDFSRFGAKQIADMRVCWRDVVFAITEGGETSFVIGTAWEALEKNAKVFFVYNNPDDLLRKHVTRSREVIDDPRIEKVNLTTGPMAIMGSTRMQATSIQLCAMLTILEMVVQALVPKSDTRHPKSEITKRFLNGLDHLLIYLSSDHVRRELAGLIYLEETVYRLGRKSTYFANSLAIDVLTDTTERSPTFCVPPFRKWDDANAAESWTFLVLPDDRTSDAWESMLHRPPYCLQWNRAEVTELIGSERAQVQARVMSAIGPDEIQRFRIGMDGLKTRLVERGDAAVCVVSESEKAELLSEEGFFRRQMESAHARGALTSLIYIGRKRSFREIEDFLLSWQVQCRHVLLPIPDANLMLDGLTRVGVKMLLNALSTCTMVRLGRVLGNCMVAVVPSNLKLIDRSIRYVQALTGTPYETACRLLFESIEYVRPRMETGQSYPPVVALTAVRARRGVDLAEAESLVHEELGENRLNPMH